MPSVKPSRRDSSIRLRSSETARERERHVSHWPSPHSCQGVGARIMARPGLTHGGRMDQPGVFVGIDVSKASLDFAVRPSGARFTLPYEPQALDSVVEQLRRLAPTLIVLKATGGWE